MKEEVVKGSDVNDEPDLGEIVSDLYYHNLIEADAENKNLQDTIIQKLASVLLT